MPTCATKSVKFLRANASGGPLGKTTILNEEGEWHPPTRERTKIARLARWRAFGSFCGEKELALVLWRLKEQ